jgi:hypothetical protein
MNKVGGIRPGDGANKKKRENHSKQYQGMHMDGILSV